MRPTEQEQLRKLSPRRLEVLVNLASSETTKSIALKLGVSAKTVEFHKWKLMEVLHIYDIAGLTRFAIRSGLIQP